MSTTWKLHLHKQYPLEVFTCSVCSQKELTSSNSMVCQNVGTPNVTNTSWPHGFSSRVSRLWHSWSCICGENQVYGEIWATTRWEIWYLRSTTVFGPRKGWLVFGLFWDLESKYIQFGRLIILTPQIYGVRKGANSYINFWKSTF